MLLFDSKGRRKYLTGSERKLFKDAADSQVEIEVRTFCLLLYHSGCRISEGLNVRVMDIDFEAEAVTFETLKKRKKKVYRQVPLSASFLDSLNLAHDLRKRQQKKDEREKRIWWFSRATASRRVDEVMQQAKITSIQACPKGLRHAFAIHCLEKGIPLNLVRKWMGHSSLEVTAIYANALGEEERFIASKMWS